MTFDKPGVAPVDPATDVGKFRLLAGGSTSEPLVPPVPGMGNYQVWSDIEIEAFIEVAGGIPRAIAMAYTQLAASWASVSSGIRTDDLQYSNKDDVANWIALAKMWSDRADAEDARAIDDYFDMVDVGRSGEWCHPELAQWPVRPW